MWPRPDAFVHVQCAWGESLLESYNHGVHPSTALCPRSRRIPFESFISRSVVPEFAIQVSRSRVEVGILIFFPFLFTVTCWFDLSFFLLRSRFFFSFLDRPIGFILWTPLMPNEWCTQSRSRDSGLAPWTKCSPIPQ